MTLLTRTTPATPNPHSGDDARIRGRADHGSPTRAQGPLVFSEKDQTTAEVLPASTAPAGSVSPAGATRARGYAWPRRKRVS